MNLNDAIPGTAVILGKHKNAEHWSYEMDKYVGRVGVIANNPWSIGIRSIPSRRYVCNVDIDGGSWVWRIANMKPANPPTNEIYMSPSYILDIVNQHQLWLFNNDEGAQADFRKVNLSGCDLSGIDLSEGIFSGANLSGANLSRSKIVNAHVDGVNFTGANLSDTNFDHSVMSDSIFLDSNLRGACLNVCNLAKANFSGADLSESLINGAKLTGTNFSNTKLHWAEIIQSTIKETDFTHASLFEAFITDCIDEEINLFTNKETMAILKSYGADVRGLRQ